MSSVFVFRLGGPIALFLEAYAGDPASVTAVSARIRRMNHDRSDYLDDAPSTAMQVQFQAAAGQQPAGWHVTIPAATAPTFKPGFYGVDIWLNNGGVPTWRQVVQLIKAAGP